MAVAFACPGCGKRFKVEDDKAGRKGKCPSCDTTFQIPAAVETASARPRPPAEDDDYDDEPPRTRPAEARRRPSDDDVDDDRPRRRKYVEDEAAEDDDREERPRKRRKKKKQGSSTGLILGLVGGAVALLLLLGGGVWFVVRSANPTTVADDLKFLPDNSPFVAVINMETITASELYKRLRQETTLLSYFQQATIAEFLPEHEDIQRLTVGQALGDNLGVVVIRSKKALNLKDIVAQSKNKLSQEEEYGRYTVRHDGFQGVAVVERKTAVTGPILTLRRILERGSTKASFSPVLESAFKELDLAKPVAAALDLQVAIAANQQRQLGGGFPFPQGGAKPGSIPDSLTIHLDLGAAATINASVFCKGATEAEELKKQTEAILALFKGPIKLPNVPRELADLLKDSQVATNDRKVNITVTVDNNTLVEVAKKVPPSQRP